VARWPFQTSIQPGLDVSGDGRGCNTLTGKFLVLDATYVGTTVQSFAANFEQHCEGQTIPLYGAIRFNSTAGRSADLSSSLSAGGTFAARTMATVVVTVTNNGPDTVTGATVRLDAAPALGEVVWTCSGAGGGSCATSGAGSLPAVTLPIRGTATLVFSVRAPALPGPVALTATVLPPPAVFEWSPSNNEAHGSFDVVLGTDLSIRQTDHQASAIAGTPVTYKITASNVGLVPVMGASVNDTVPATIDGAAWTCVAAGGATCTSSGFGSIHDGVSLPTGATITYTLTGSIIVSATGSLINTASVAGPEGFVDEHPSDNVATDVDALSAPPRSVAIGDITVKEGDSGMTTASIPVILSRPSDVTVRVSYMTSDVTAVAGRDYLANSGVLTFPPGTTSQTIAVSVLGDTVDEPDEAFAVTLSSPVGASLGRSRGQVTILDDDGRPSLCAPIGALPFPITAQGRYCLTGNLSTAIAT
jgi:uncharacterized repeat protein (TIGR01451 family)